LTFWPSSWISSVPICARSRASAITLSLVRLRSGPRVKGHHAIGAGFVAAFDDGDVSAVRIVAAGERRLESVFGIQAQAGDAAIAGFELHQHLGQLGVAGRSGHQADVRRAFEDALAFLLRHASQHAESFSFAVRA
jgi:hypothetical protein